MPRKTVALVIPTKDKLDHLRQTLPKAVTLGFNEVIVIDSSTKDRDAVEALCTSLNVKYLFTPVDRLRARNLGATASNSDWICIMDDDILVSRFDFDKFQTLSDELDYMIGGWGKDPGAHYAWIFRRDFFLDVLKGYDLLITGGDDLDITLRASKSGKGIQAFDKGLYETEAIGLGISRDYPSTWIRNRALYSLTMLPLVRRYPWLIRRLLLSDVWRLRSGTPLGRVLFEGFIEKSGLIFSPINYTFQKRRLAKS